MSIDYSFFDKKLKEQFDFDFNNFVNQMTVAGNGTGIYSDVALLLCKLVSHPQVNVVLELGCGVSTCVLAKMLSNNKKIIFSVEDIEHWYKITQKCLTLLGLRNDNFVCTLGTCKNAPDIPTVDVAWVDGSIEQFNDSGKSRMLSCDYYRKQLEHAVLLLDDVNVIPEIYPWLESWGRDKNLFHIFNPTGRGDRQVLISMPNKDHYLYSTVSLLLDVHNN